ncbi:MAG: beta/gamma crystallin-related protein [Caulobacterales bacterium]|jgi:hypothetical protein
MRATVGLSVLVLLGAGSAFAQPRYAPPRGSYERQCGNIQMNGQFLSATCRGTQGGGQSSINILSCSGDISVDPSGALSCLGPGAKPPPAVRYDAPRNYLPDQRQGYDPGARYGARPGRYERDAVTLFSARNWRGQPVRIEGEAANLDAVGLNDQVRSIQLGRGSGAWLVCSDANYRGRCVTISQSLADTRAIGMRDSISSLRPAR